MTSDRLQHILPASVVATLATVVAWLSFTQEPAAAFLFPRIISVAFVILAAWNLIRAVAGMSKVGSGISTETAVNILPGLVIMLVYVFWAAKGLGFYLSSTIAFFLIYSIYDPAPLSSARDWVKRIVVTVLFMAVIYGLFAKLLLVQTPRGVFL